MPKVKRLYRATVTRTYKDWYADEEKTQTMTRHFQTKSYRDRWAQFWTDKGAVVEVADSDPVMFPADYGPDIDAVYASLGFDRDG